MTKVTAIKPFRPQVERGHTVRPGDSLEVEDDYAADLIRQGLAVSGTKMLKDHQNKMQAHFENKQASGFDSSALPKTPEERTEGRVGPVRGSLKPEDRTQGLFHAKDPHPQTERQDNLIVSVFAPLPPGNLPKATTPAPTPPKENAAWSTGPTPGKPAAKKES